MKKILKLALAAVILGCSLRMAEAACAPTDMFCYASGPYANQTQIGKLDASGNLTVNGSVTSAGVANSGSLTNTGNATISGKTIFPVQAVVAITSITVIVPTATYITVVSTGGNVTCGLVTTVAGAAAPCVSTATATNGQYLIIASSSSTNTMTFKDAATAGMDLGGDRLVDNNNTLTVIYDSTSFLWKEVAFGSN